MNFNSEKDKNKVVTVISKSKYKDLLIKELIANAEIYASVKNNDKFHSIMELLYSINKINTKYYTGKYRIGEDKLVVIEKKGLLRAKLIKKEEDKEKKKDKKKKDKKKDKFITIYPENTNLFYMKDYNKILFDQNAHDKRKSVLFYKFGKYQKGKRIS